MSRRRKASSKADVYTLIEAAVTSESAARSLLRDHPALAEARTPDMQESALHYLAIENDCAAARILLDLGLAVDARDASEATPLLYAAKLNYPEMSALLLRYGADPNIRDDLDETPLHKASQHGALEVIKLLLVSGADPTASTDLGKTPRDLALPRKRSEIEALLDASAPRADDA